MSRFLLATWDGGGTIPPNAVIPYWGSCTTAITRSRHRRRTVSSIANSNAAVEPGEPSTPTTTVIILLITGLPSRVAVIGHGRRGIAAPTAMLAAS